MAAATMYVDAAADGEGDGTTWAEAFDEAQFEADLEANAEPGDIYYVQAGTYTLDSAYDSSAKDGTAVAPISIIGVKAATTNEPPVLADWGSGADRPSFVCGANAVTFGDYYKVYNCIFTGDAASVVTVGIRCCEYNCKFTNNSETASRYALNTGTNNGGRVISCELISTVGRALLFSPSGLAMFNYIHDSATGVHSGYNGIIVAFNVIDSCTTGIYLTGGAYAAVLNNTIYNTTTAITGGDIGSSAFINNIIDTATDGFKWTTTTNSNFFAYNHKGNNVTEMFDTATAAYTLFHGDQWATTPGDPKFTDAAGGDFSLASDSPCIDAGMTITLGVG